MPGAGDNFLVVPEDRVARQIAEQRQARERSAQLANSRQRTSLEDILKRIEEGKVDQLNLILKGDVSGSVEALEDALLKIEVDDEVSLRIIGPRRRRHHRERRQPGQRVRRRHPRLQRPARGARLW